MSDDKPKIYLFVLSDPDMLTVDDLYHMEASRDMVRFFRSRFPFGMPWSRHSLYRAWEDGASLKWLWWLVVNLCPSKSFFVRIRDAVTEYVGDKHPIAIKNSMRDEVVSIVDMITTRDTVVLQGTLFNTIDALMHPMLLYPPPERTPVRTDFSNVLATICIDQLCKLTRDSCPIWHDI